MTTTRERITNRFRHTNHRQIPVRVFGRNTAIGQPRNGHGNDNDKGYMMNMLASDNSYNSENDLSAQINFTIYGADESCDWCWADDIYVALCVHQGGDVRGNYGGVRIYLADSLADTGFLDWTLGWHVETAELSGVDQDDLGKKHLKGLTWAVDDNLTERCSPGYASLPSSELYSGTTDNDSCYWIDGSAYLTDGETVWKATPYHYYAELDLPKDGSGWICDASIDTESFLAETLGEELETTGDFSEAWDHAQQQQRKAKPMKSNNMTTYFSADCDEFDNAATGWHLSEQGAIESFWSENTFSDWEKSRVNVYVRTIENPTAEELTEQAEVAKAQGLICVTNPELARFAI